MEAASNDGIRSGRKTLRQEAAEASKQAILDAAEALFAEKGYNATSLQEICDRAEVARGLPGYFFGSKEGLYRAVLDRTFTRPQELIQLIHEEAHRPGMTANELLSMVVDRLFENLTTNQTFVRMTEWESLHRGAYLGGLPAQLRLFRDAVQVLQEDLGWQGDAELLLLDLTALCWFPSAHSETFLKPLGLDIHDPEFRARYKRHLIDMLLRSTTIRRDDP